MNIGINGAGKIGGTAARLFVPAGHQVVIGNSRGPASLASLAEDLGSKARAADR
jgi:predicted dinucleotide-binding enzyme